MMNCVQGTTWSRRATAARVEVARSESDLAADFADFCKPILGHKGSTAAPRLMGRVEKPPVERSV